MHCILIMIDHDDHDDPDDSDDPDDPVAVAVAELVSCM